MRGGKERDRLFLRFETDLIDVDLIYIANVFWRMAAIMGKEKRDFGFSDYPRSCKLPKKLGENVVGQMPDVYRHLYEQKACTLEDYEEIKGDFEAKGVKVIAEEMSNTLDLFARICRAFIDLGFESPAGISDEIIEKVKKNCNATRTQIEDYFKHYEHMHNTFCKYWREKGPGW